MFYDEVLQRSSRAGEKCHQIVIERRERVYNKRLRDVETGEIETIEIARGWEIAKVIKTTEAGVKQWLETHPLDKTI
jgi:hypothetical protein